MAGDGRQCGAEFRGRLGLVRYVARLLAAERRFRVTPARSRKLSCRAQAVLALRWFRDRTRTGALERALAEGVPYVILDGKVFGTDACAGTTENARGEEVHRWYSGRKRRCGAGYQGAGIGVHTPAKNPKQKKGTAKREPGENQRTRNLLLRGLRCQGERGFALLPRRWATLQHITASPGRTTQITRAALVLTQWEHKYLKQIL